RIAQAPALNSLTPARIHGTLTPWRDLLPAAATRCDRSHGHRGKKDHGRQLESLARRQRCRSVDCGTSQLLRLRPSQYRSQPYRADLRFAAAVPDRLDPQLRGFARACHGNPAPAPAAVRAADIHGIADARAPARLVAR